MIEHEKKILLSKQEYNTLMETMCKDTQTTIQTNYYFDTDDLSMNKNGITCRIRSKNGQFMATVKKHINNDTGVSIEKHIKQSNTFNSDYFEKMGLKLQGNLITERTIAYKDNNCEVVLDRNIYLGHTDYEMEIEYGESHSIFADKIIRKIAKKLYGTNYITNINDLFDRIHSSKSKSERFFEQMKHIGPRRDSD